MKRQVYVKPEIRQAFEAKIVETLEKAKSRHGKDIPPISLHFLACGGRAGYFQQKHKANEQFIVINPQYFTKPGGYEEQLNITLPHEVAHYITRFLYGIDRTTVRSHGWQWAQVMRWIGLPPIRCHTMDTTGIEGRRERPYSYSCNCEKPHLLTATLHLRIQRDGSHRRCRICRSRIEYKGIVVNGHFTPAAKTEPKSLNEIRTVHLAPRVIGVAFVPPQPKPTPVPETGFRVVTRMIDGVLQNVRVPLDNH